jgi:hypothetical protein
VFLGCRIASFRTTDEHAASDDERDGVTRVRFPWWYRDSPCAQDGDEGVTHGETHDRSRLWPIAVSAIGVLSTVGMCVGALGPWAHAEVISFSGWAGIGFPLVILAFVALVLAILHAFVPRRAWLIICLLIGAVSLICAVLLMLLESLLSHAGSVVALLIARGAHRDILSSHPVTLAWGIPVLAGSSLLLCVASTAGLFGRFPESALSRLWRDRGDGDLGGSPDLPSTSLDPSDVDIYRTP